MSLLLLVTRDRHISVHTGQRCGARSRDQHISSTSQHHRKKRGSNHKSSSTTSSDRCKDWVSEQSEQKKVTSPHGHRERRNRDRQSPSPPGDYRRDRDRSQQRPQSPEPSPQQVPLFQQGPVQQQGTLPFSETQPKASPTGPQVAPQHQSPQQSPPGQSQSARQAQQPMSGPQTSEQPAEVQQPPPSNQKSGQQIPFQQNHQLPNPEYDQQGFAQPQQHPEPLVQHPPMAAQGPHKPPQMQAPENAPAAQQTHSGMPAAPGSSQEAQPQYHSETTTGADSVAAEVFPAESAEQAPVSEVIPPASAVGHDLAERLKRAQSQRETELKEKQHLLKEVLAEYDALEEEHYKQELHEAKMESLDMLERGLRNKMRALEQHQQYVRAAHGR